MRPLVRTTTCDCLSQWIGDQVTETFRTGQGQYSSVADPHGYQGLTGSKGTFMGSPAAPAFHEVPTRGLRTIGQRAAGKGSLDTRGSPCWLPLAPEERV